MLCALVCVLSVCRDKFCATDRFLCRCTHTQTYTFEHLPILSISCMIRSFAWNQVQMVWLNGCSCYCQWKLFPLMDAVIAAAVVFIRPEDTQTSIYPTEHDTMKCFHLQFYTITKSIQWNTSSRTTIRSLSKC